MKLFSIVASLVLAGCCCCKNNDPVIGNWGLKLPYENMYAGHMIISRMTDGSAEALVLWRWGSPTIAQSCVVEGNKFTINRGDFIFKGEVQGDKLIGESFRNGKSEGKVEGWKNPEIEPADTAKAKLGAPIDLLKDGIEGWESMNPGAKFGWSYKDGILSNKLPLKADGKHERGANIKSKRADFYDFNLEFDVRVPKNSNSGVYLRGRYECQVFDSFGKEVNCHNMAAYYGRVTPLVAAEKAPGEWQHVSATLYHRHLTIVLNGVKIIDNAPVVGITGGAIDANEFVPGPIYLQGDHSDADYRNMILRPVID